MSTALVTVIAVACGDSQRVTPSAAEDEQSTTVPAAVSTTVPLTDAGSSTSIVAPVSLPTLPRTVFESLDVGPLSPRFGAATVALGRSIFVYGGLAVVGGDTQPIDDGAVYDVDLGTWSPLPTSAGLAAGATEAVVWAGSIVFAGASGAAIFDPAKGAWGSLPAPQNTGTLVAAGSSLFAVVPFAWAEEGAAQLSARLDPVTRTWAELAPLPGALAEFAEVGEELLAIVYAKDETVPDFGGFAQRTLVALRLDGDAWVDLAMPELEVSFGRFAVANGSELFVWGDSAYGHDASESSSDHGLKYSVADRRWSEIAPLPTDWWECYVTAAAVDGELVIDICGTVASYDLVTGEMAAAPLPVTRTPARFVLVDGAAYRWGEEYCYGCDHPLLMAFQRVAPAS